MIIHPFRAIYPDLVKIADHQGFFDSVKAQFPEYAASGMFLQDDEECCFVYDIVTEKGTQRGIVVNVDVQDYFDGRIRRHEHTIPERESMMRALFLERNALIKPVLNDSQSSF